MPTSYGLDDFQREISAMQPRPVDIWLLPPLVMYAAWKSRDLGRWTRRIMFSAGIYMMYRNWTKYKEAVASVAALTSGKTEASV
jgi:hypothetical protein